MSCSVGDKIKVQIFGQSHSQFIGVVIDNLPAGKHLDIDKIENFLQRRKGAKNAYSTKRNETDKPTIVSGIVDNRTCGAPLCAIFKNEDTRSQDYDNFANIPRPSHADYVASVKHNGCNDIRGGGNFSGRMTLPLCFAGAVCIQLLEDEGIKIGAHIYSIANIKDKPYSMTKVNANDLIADASFPCNDKNIANEMEKYLTEVAAEGNSVGGIIECGIVGTPVGLGEPMFDGIENKISQLIFSIPAVKGIEFGSGFNCATMLGTEHNDILTLKDGKVQTESNNSGGIVGGISNAMPIIFRVAIKPTPSIAVPQKTLDVSTEKISELIIKGRHDPCIVPRAVPVVEAAAAIAIYDLL